MAKVELREEDFPSNSRASRVAPIRESKRKPTEEADISIERKSKFRRIPKGSKAVRRKRTLTQSIAESLVGEGSQNVGGYILHEVLLPAAKSTIADMITGAIEMVLYGETKPKGRGDKKDRNYVSYGSYYRGSREDRDERPARRKFATRGDPFDLGEIYFRQGYEADDVLSQLQDALTEYEEVSVSDFFDIAGIDGAKWAHAGYGWTNLDKAYCTHTRNGWQIVFPDPIKLDID